MTYALRAKTGSQGNSPNVCTFGISAGDRVLVIVQYADTRSVTSLTDSANNTYTQIGSPFHNTFNAEYWAAYECLNAAAATTITLTLDAVSNCIMLVNCYTGLSTTVAGVKSFLFTNPTTVITDDTTSGTMAPPSAPAVVFGVQGYYAVTPTVGTGFTDDGQYTGTGMTGTHFVAEHKRVTDTSAVAATFTWPSAGQNTVIIGVAMPEPGSSSYPIETTLYF
jgi:hypothetical protein